MAPTDFTATVYYVGLFLDNPFSELVAVAAAI